MTHRIFSGIQPTGNLHLGNYLGAIRQWVRMQDEMHALPVTAGMPESDSGGISRQSQRSSTTSIFGIMDLHSITVPQDPENLKKAVYEVVAACLASGVNAENNLFFVQSSVPQHAELSWILGCFTPLGWLNRMTQFKEKSGKHKDNSSLGLYAYPVLQAADVLLYHGTHVPVGEDQKQHVELMRDIAGAFNRRYESEYFPLPEPVIKGEATRVMSLRDGTKKMSKSDPSDYSRIVLTDDADTIALKFRKAKSDMEPTLTYDQEKRPEAANLINIYCALTGTGRDAVVARFADSGFSAFKKELADAAVAHLSPISSEMRRLMADTAYLDSVLHKGQQSASAIAERTVKEVKELVGFWSHA